LADVVGAHKIGFYKIKFFFKIYITGFIIVNNLWYFIQSP
jgi:hypothetical protein